MTEPTDSTASNSAASNEPIGEASPLAAAPPNKPESAAAAAAEGTPPAAAPANQPESSADAAAESLAASSEKKSGKKPKVKAPGRWRRRIVRTFMFIIVLGLGLQILLWCLLPWTLRRAAKFYDLDLTCDRPDLSLFNSDAGLWHVKVTQHGQPVASVDYCRADISILNLFRGKLIIQRLEADGVDLTVQRDADGTIPLLKGILFAGPQPGTAPVKKTPGAKPTPIDLRAPVAIDALVLTHVRTHFIDQAVKPALNTELQMNLRLTDLASPQRPAKFSMQLIPSPLSTPLLDSIVLEAGCKKINDSQSLSLYFNASARGLHPKLLEGYLSPLGVRVTADGIAMTARGTIDLNVIPTNPNALTGAINLNTLAITADEQPAATMKSVAINLDSLSANAATISKIALADGTFLAQRTAAGGFKVAGFEFTPGTAADSPTIKPSTDTAAASSTQTTPAASSATAASAPFICTLTQFTLANFRASFKDAAVKPAADIEFLINDLTLKNLSTDPAQVNSPIAITGDFAAPGILRDVKIAGICQALAAKKTFSLSVNAGGIHPEALGPYFAMMGVDPTLKSAQFTCQVSADLSLPSDNSYSANAQLTNIKFEDGQELLALDDLKLSGIGIAPGTIRVDSIEVKGPRAAARREKSGTIWAAGFRLVSSAAKSSLQNPNSSTTPVLRYSEEPGSSAKSPALRSTSEPASGKQGNSETASKVATAAPSPRSKTASATTRPAVNPSLAALPKIDIGRFVWSGVQLTLDDEAAPEGVPETIGIKDAGVELTGLHIDFDPNAPAALSPAKLHAFVKAPGLASNIDLNGTIAQRPGGLTADLEITGEKLSAILATPYLKAMNVQPTLREGAIHANAHIDVAQLDDGISATVSASDFKLSDPTGELLGANEAAINGILLTADALEVGEVTLKKPRGQFSRDENGAVNALGFRLLPTPPTPKKSAFAAASLPGAGGVGVAVPAPLPPTTAPATQPAETQLALMLKKFSIRDGEFKWTDRQVKPTAQIIARVDGDLAGATWGRPADPMKLDFKLKADGIVDEARLAGTIAATPESAVAKLDISALGLRQGALASYLPPGMTIELKDGQFKTHLDANVAINAKGGAGGKLTVTSLDYREANESQPLFSLDSVNVAVPRIDMEEGVIEVDEVTVAGAQGWARKGKDGTLHAMGIAIAQPKGTQVVFICDHADGLSEGSPVFYAGVEVGKITAIGSVGDNSQVRIEALIDNDPPIPKNLTGQIRLQSALASSRAIHLETIGSPAGTLSSGDSIRLRFVDGVSPAATQPATREDATTAPATVAASVSDVPDQGTTVGPLKVVKPKHPLITVKKLDIAMKRFVFTDESRENVPPIAVSDLHLFASKPIEALGKDAGNRPAAELGLKLKVDDVIDSLAVDLKAAPFAGEPWFSVSVAGSGIHGEGLIAQVPDLKSQIDASQLTDGRLSAHFGAKLKIDRFDPLEFPLDHAFDLDFSVKNVEFRAADKGPILIGVEEIRSEGIHVQPAAKLISAKILEVDNIVGQATRETDGIHALGIVLKLPAATTQPATAAASATATEPSNTKPAVVATTTPAPKPTVIATTAPATTQSADDPGEVRIGKFFVSGLDFRFQDNTVSPPLIVPLNQLDVEVRNLSTKAFTEVRPPTRFSVLVGAGKVPLPKKINTRPSPVPTPASLANALPLPGIKKPAAPAKVEVTSAGMEDRDLFSQIQADGEMSFYPRRKGWAKASVNAFDLASITSTVKAHAPISVYNGVFDMSADVRFPGDDTAPVNLDLYLTDVDFVEPPNGPVQTALGLPLTMDVVFGLLDRGDGAIHVPVSQTLHDTNFAGEILPAIGHAILPMTADAAKGKAAMAVNAVGSVANAVIPFSAIFGQSKPKDNGPFEIHFAAGDDGLSMADLMRLNVAIERLKEEPEMTITLRSELSGGPSARSLNLETMTGDIGRARLRANPSKEECRELINRLSRRKDDLTRRRLDVLGDARGSLASRSPAEAAAVLERLRAVERELTTTEDALDRLYELERPGAERQTNRRTKTTALDVARSRQRAIIDYVKAAGVANAADRVKTTRPTFAPVESSDVTGGSVVLTVVIHKT
jgi:hypothetical protein